MFTCPRCGSHAWGTGLGSDCFGSGPVGVCHTETRLDKRVGGCGYMWKRTRENDAALGVGGIIGDGPCVVDERDYGSAFTREKGGCGTTDKPGCVMYSDGTCSCARNVGVNGACGPCSKKMGVAADVDDLAFLDARQRAVHQAYPDRDIGGWDVWVFDAKVEPIWVKIMAANGYDAAHAEKVRAYAAGTPKTDPTATLQPMSIWPMVAVGVVAIGIFAATLAINPKR